MMPKKIKFRKWHRMRENPKKARVATRGKQFGFRLFRLGGAREQRSLGQSD